MIPAMVITVRRAAIRALRPAVSPMNVMPSQVKSKNSARNIAAAVAL